MVVVPVAYGHYKTLGASHPEADGVRERVGDNREVVGTEPEARVSQPDYFHRFTSKVG